MKRFNFKLEPLLRVRRMQEERALGELARVMRRVNEQEAVRDQARRSVEEEMGRFEARYREQFQIDLYQIYDRYLERLQTEAAEAGKRLEAMRPEVEQEMAKAMEARRGRRIVEIIKERKKTEYDRARRKAEAKELEEINRMRRDVERARAENSADFSGGNYADAKHRQPVSATEADELYTGDDGIDEPEQPAEKPDYVSDYFDRMGLKKPK
jgi:flagellar protein FliJ